jgi:hypothetical protein
VKSGEGKLRRLGPETELSCHGSSTSSTTSSSTTSSSTTSSSSSSSSSSRRRRRRRRRRRKKKVFVPKSKAVIEGRRKFRIEELHHLCISSYFVQKIKSAE